jgi:RNase P subunit RPR2
MTVRELIYTEIDKIGEESLDELYEIAQRFVQVKSNQPETGALSKLRRIKIQAPEDFAANLDLYLSSQLGATFCHNSAAINLDRCPTFVVAITASETPRVIA